MQSQERFFPQGTPLDTGIFAAAFLATAAEFQNPTEGDTAELPTAFRKRHHRLLALACAGALAGPLQSCSSYGRDKEELIQVVKGEEGTVSIYRDAKGKFSITGIEGKYRHVDARIINGKAVVVVQHSDEHWEVFGLNRKSLARGAEITIISLNGKEFFHVDDNEWEIIADDGRIIGRYSKQKIADGTAATVIMQEATKDCENKKSGRASMKRTGLQYLIDDRGKQLWKGRSISKMSFGGKDFLYISSDEGDAICDEQGSGVTPWYKSIDQKTLNGNNDFLLVERENGAFQLQRFSTKRSVTEECRKIDVVKFSGRDVLLVASTDDYEQLLDDAGQPLLKGKYKRITLLPPFGNDILGVALENGKLQLLRSDETPMTGECVKIDGITIGTDNVFKLTLPNGWQTVVTMDERRPVQPKPVVEPVMFHDNMPGIWVKHPDGNEQVLALLDGTPLTNAYSTLQQRKSWWWGENAGRGFEIADNPELRDYIPKLLQRLHIAGTVTQNDTIILDELIGDEKNKETLFEEGTRSVIPYLCSLMKLAGIPVHIGDLPAMIDFDKTNTVTDIERASEGGRLNGKKSVSEALTALSAFFK